MNLLKNIFMNNSVSIWTKIGLYNLLLVAFIGTILRYKIAFSLPFIDQKHLMHGHAHFAFVGWVTQLLMVLILQDLSKHSKTNVLIKYQKILFANLITAYGMLFTFPIQGYGSYSIIFSTLSIFVFYWFAYVVYKEMKDIKIQKDTFIWYKAALTFGILSSFGALTLAFFMATLQKNQHNYLLSVYGYLHFQYNGWFFFALTGIVIQKIGLKLKSGILLKVIFWFFFIACIPAYFLSTLWLALPNWLYTLVVVAAIFQALALLGIWKLLLQVKDQLQIRSNPGNYLLLLSLIALSIKIILQLFSTIPILSQIAFGYRSIVVGYLHLMLLGVISIGMLGFLISEGILLLNKVQQVGLWIFIAGVLLNQIVLMIQGITGMQYVYIPYLNEALFFIALTMFIGLFTFIFCRTFYTNKLL